MTVGACPQLSATTAATVAVCHSYYNDIESCNQNQHLRRGPAALRPRPFLTRAGPPPTALLRRSATAAAMAAQLRRCGSILLSQPCHGGGVCLRRTVLLLLVAAAAAELPPVGTVCCPSTRTYLPQPRTTTALMTFPGSGNTWVRHIIETLTGFHTSSVYCDKSLQPVFQAECDDSYLWEKSIAVKTHMFSCWWKRAIVVIRHPLRAILGDYQRLRTGGSHTGVVDPSLWDWDDWYALSTRQCLKWTSHFARIFGDGAANPGCSNSTEFKVFFYEDLKTPTGALNPYFLDELLDWFGVDKDDSFYDCAMFNNKGSFARKLRADHPATRIFNDTETLRRMTDAGCLAAYDRYAATYPHLPQPEPTEPPHARLL